MPAMNAGDGFLVLATSLCQLVKTAFVVHFIVQSGALLELEQMCWRKWLICIGAAGGLLGLGLGGVRGYGAITRGIICDGDMGERHPFCGILSPKA